MSESGGTCARANPRTKPSGFAARGYCRGAATGVFSGLAATLCAIFALALGPAAEAQASYLPGSGLPSMRLAQTDPVSPAQALAFYGDPSSPPAGARDVRIQALARGLEHDPDRIYAYVRNNIEFEPIFGLHKGAAGTWQDKSGGAFDQANLLVDLLRESGFSARYVFGTVQLGPEAAAILRVNTAAQACQLLADAGTPAIVNGQSGCSQAVGAITSVQMLHVWVEATVDGVTYAFDPALKSHKVVAGVDVWAAMGLNPATAVSQMNAGAVLANHRLSGLNTAAIEGVAQSGAQGLLGPLSSKTLTEVTGGWSIIPGSMARQATLPYIQQVSARWDGEVPAPFRASLRIQATQFDHTFDLPDIYADRVQIQGRQISYNSTGVESTNVVVFIRRCQGFAPPQMAACSGAAQVVGGNLPYSVGQVWDGAVSLTISHPYAANGGAYMRETVRKVLAGGSRADLLIDVGGSDGERYAAHRAATDSFVLRNYVPSVRDCVQSFLEGGNFTMICSNILSGGWYEDGLDGGAVDLSTSQTTDGPHDGSSGWAEMVANKDHVANLWWSAWSDMLASLAPLSQSRIIHHHSLGVVQDTAPWNSPTSNDMAENAIDVETAVSIVPLGSYRADEVLGVAAAFGSAMEASAVRELAAERLSKVYARWSAAPDVSVGVRSVLTPFHAGAGLTVLNPGDSSALLPAGVDANVAARVTQYLQGGFTVAVPDGSSVNGILARRSDGSEVSWLQYQPGKVGLGGPSAPQPGAFRKGAVAGVPNPLGYLGDEDHREPAAAKSASFKDAVNLRNGYLSIDEPPDLVVGHGEFPYSLGIRRSYSTSGFADSGGLGPGWTHTFASALTRSNPALPPLDGKFPPAAAGTVAALALALEVANGDSLQAALEQGALTDWWWRVATAAPQISVSVGAESEQFTKLIDGSWRSTTASGDTLAFDEAQQFPSLFTRTLRDGSVQTFQELMQKSLSYEQGTGHYALMQWAFPNGVGVGLQYGYYDNGGVQHLTAVGNTLGLSLAFDVRNDELFCGGPSANTYACEMQAENHGTLAGVSSPIGGVATTFTYSGGCDLNSNLCVRLLSSAAQVGRRTRSYHYSGDTPQLTFSDGTSSNGFRQWDSFNLLASVVDSTAPTTPRASFVYEGAGLLVPPHVIASTDALGHVSRYYTTGDFAGSSVDPAGGRVTMAYDAAGRPVQQVDGVGNVTTYAYDNLGRLTLTTEPEGNAEQKVYDARSNVVQLKRLPKPNLGGDPLATLTTYPESGAAQCVHPANCNKPLTVTDARGAVTQYTFDPDTGVLVSVVAPPDRTGAVGETDYGYTTYAGMSLLTSKLERIDATHTVTTGYGYDAANHYYPKTVTADAGGLGLVTTSLYNPLGDLIQIDGPRTDVSDVKNYAWDAFRRLRYTIGVDPDGGGPARRPTTNYAYDGDDELTDVFNGTATDAQGSDFTALEHTQHIHDVLGNEIREIVYDGVGTARLALKDLSYDPANRLLCEAVRMSPAGVGAPPADACALIDATTPDRITHYAYDFAGRRIAEDHAYRTPLLITYAYEYTPNGQRRRIHDAEDHVTRLDYDAFDRLSRQSFPLPGRDQHAENPADYEAYGYDSNDNRTSLRRRNGQSLTYRFDALDRMIERHLEGDAGHDVYYDYDLLGHMTAARFGSVTGAGAVMTYDPIGRLVRDETFGHAVVGTYGNGADRTTLAVDGVTTTYDFDPADRLRGIREAGQAAVCPTVGTLICIGRDPLGRRAHIDRGNGGTADYQYDGAGRLKSVAQAGGTDQPAALQSVSFNPASQVVSLTEANDNYVWTGRPPQAPNRTFDGLNRDLTYVAVSGASYTCNGAVQSSGGYDCNGNLVSDGPRLFSYDLENRLIRVAPGPGQTGVTLDLSYDPLGRLATTTATTSSGATTTGFVYDGDRLVEEADGSGVALRRYVHGDGVDDPLVWYDASGRRYLHADRQGSIMATSDDSGSVVTYTYGPYGEVVDWAGPRFRYTGQIALPESRLYHYKARAYDPEMGRFLQTDPVGYDAGDLNLYAYVKDDPANETDPTGNCPECVTALVGAAVGGGVEMFKQTHLEGKSLSQVNWTAVGKEALIGGVAGGTGAGLGGLVAKTGATLTAAAVTGGVTAGVSSALHGDKPAAVAVKTIVGAALGPAAKVAGTKVTQTLGAAPKAVPGQIVTWGASKTQQTGAAAAGWAASKALTTAGNGAVAANCKEQGACK